MGAPIQFNIEYLFRLIYDLFFGSHGGVSVNSAQFLSVVTQVWVIVTFLGYVIAAAAIFVIIYATMRLFTLRARERAFYGTMITAPAPAGPENPRWKRIQELAAGVSPSEWREAIIEADIMLNDMLTRQGYTGESVGEKLRSVDSADFDTLSDAWEAHKVRNQIAHEGSAFDLSETLVRRTIAQYERVFREFEIA